ncbi:hypothetical protein [Hymenobacter saemangeumensis]|uniref:hypothetical protein n=1 Tax=Hymenobacter saemangeumensis TaxID=1084522 RepID=UPI0031F1335C
MLKPSAALALLLLLGACDRQKPVETTTPPASPTPAAAPARAVEKILTSGDTWPATTHDTLHLGRGVARVLPGSGRLGGPARPELPPRPEDGDSPELAKAQGRVQREGIQLRFKPEQGPEVVIKNDTADTEAMAFYHYWGTLASARQWVVSVGLYEGSAVELIDQRTGRRTPAWGQPVASPDGRYVVTYSADLGAAFDPNGLQLFKVEPTGLRLVWERDLSSWEPRQVSWLDNTTLLIKQAQGPAEEDGKPQSAYMRLDLSQVL